MATRKIGKKPTGVHNMLDHIMAELRYIRKRLDDHIDDEDHTHEAIRTDVSSLKEEFGSHRTKMKGIVTGATIVVMAFVTWLFGLVPK